MTYYDPWFSQYNDKIEKFKRFLDDCDEYHLECVPHEASIPGVNIEVFKMALYHPRVDFSVDNSFVLVFLGELEDDEEGRLRLILDDTNVDPLNPVEMPLHKCLLGFRPHSFEEDYLCHPEVVKFIHKLLKESYGIQLEKNVDVQRYFRNHRELLLSVKERLVEEFSDVYFKGKDLSLVEKVEECWEERPGLAKWLITKHNLSQKESGLCKQDFDNYVGRTNPIGGFRD